MFRQTSSGMFLQVSIIILTTSVSLFSVSAKNKDESCYATMECSDAGLFCTGARCQCIVDIDPESGKFWGCNKWEDCQQANAIVQQALPAKLASKTEPPVCTFSQQCSALPGYAGYCFFSLLP